MRVGRIAGLVSAFFISIGTVHAQKQALVELPKVGECFKIELTTSISGNLKIINDGKAVEIPVQAKSQHSYFEKILKEANGLASKSARRYETATSVAKVGNETINRSLRAERSLIVAQRFDDQHLCYSPGGPLTRPEMEVVSEHFNSLCLNALLPGREVEIGNDWSIGNAAVQSFCQFDGLVGHTLKGTFKEVKNSLAIIRIVGDAEGIEGGAQVKLNVDAFVDYDTALERIVKVTWNQTDERDQGPISPSSSLKSTATLKREFLKYEPKELNPVALVGVPTEDDPPGLLKTLSVKDLKDRFSFLHSRDWHAVSQSENYTILRSMFRGEFLAQATILPWEKLEAGKKISVEDFKKAISQSKGWRMDEILDAGQVASEDDRWIYRLVARGEMDGLKVIQSFYMIVGPKGDHLLATFTTKAGDANKIGTKDVELVNSIEFSKK